MIRRERAEFLDNVLKLFDGKRTIKRQELELKYKEDSYIFYQNLKHLKILEADGMVLNNGLGEYHLQAKGLRVLNEIESLGYLARHKVAAADFDRKEEEEENDEFDNIVCLLVYILVCLLGPFNQDVSHK